MVITKTQTLYLETPAAAIALSPDENLLAVVGSHLFKIYKVKENGELEDSINLRSSKNQNLNYSSSDVEFCPTDDRILASASTNGSVIIWNIKNGRAKLKTVFKDHGRTVNRINFHPTDEHLLLSGSQDGQMKLFDDRRDESVLTFCSNSESVRDIQFNPHLTHYFAAGTDSCNVQLWDMRRPDKYERLITGHRGPVFALDWHPEDPHCIATASRDCTIKIWDVSEQSLTVTSAITTVAAVARVKWRPTHYYHLASCSLTVDSSACIWDVQRPFVPIASFAYHRESTSALQWRPKSNSFITVSKDGRLFHHCLEDAYHPRLRGCPFPLTMSPRGDMGFCAPTRARNKEKVIADDIDKLEHRTVVSHKRQTSLTSPMSCGGGSTPSSPATPVGPSSFSQTDRLPCTPLNPATPTLPPNPNNNADLNFNILNFPPPNLGMRELATFEDIGPILSDFSVLSWDDDSLSVTALRDYGQNYKLEGGTDHQFWESCQHNANISARNHRPQEAKMWEILQIICLGHDGNPSVIPNSNNKAVTTSTSGNNSATSAAITGASVVMTDAGKLTASAAAGDSSKGKDDKTCSPSKDEDVYSYNGDDGSRGLHGHDDDDDAAGGDDRDYSDDDPDDALDDNLSRRLKKSAKFSSMYRKNHFAQSDLYFGDSECLDDFNDPPASSVWGHSRGGSNRRSTTTTKSHHHHASSSAKGSSSSYFANFEDDDHHEQQHGPGRPLVSNEELIVIRDEAFEPQALHSYMTDCDTNEACNIYDHHRNNDERLDDQQQLSPRHSHRDHQQHRVHLQRQRRHPSSGEDGRRNNTLDSGGENDSGEVESGGSDGKCVLATTMPLFVNPSAIPSVPAFDFTDTIVETLKYTALRGDMATCVTAFIVLGDRIKKRIPEDLVEHWFLFYIDQLQRLRLFNRASIIMQNAHGLENIQQMNQISTLVVIICPQCHADLPPKAFKCRKCHHVVNKCSWCQEVVAGLYVVCQGCCHGGHLYHLAEWFKDKKKVKDSPCIESAPLQVDNISASATTLLSSPSNQIPTNLYTNNTLINNTLITLGGTLNTIGVSLSRNGSSCGATKPQVQSSNTNSTGPGSMTIAGTGTGYHRSYNGNPFVGAAVTSNVFAEASSNSSFANFTQMGNLVCPAGCGHLCQFM